MYNPVKDSNCQVKIARTAEQTVSALSRASFTVQLSRTSAQEKNVTVHDD